MAAEEHLSREQFYTSPRNKKTYHLVHNGYTDVSATPVGNKRIVGFVNYFKEGFHDKTKPEVFRAQVRPAHQRQGLASAMFDFAEKHAPGLQHSRALSDDGKAFVEGHSKKRAWRDAT